jgi:hypothetical protein
LATLFLDYRTNVAPYTLAPDANAFWQNRSFHNYADYAMTAVFAPASPGSVIWAACGAAP